MDIENKGYAISLSSRSNSEREERVFLKPMALYVPAVAAQAMTDLISHLSGKINLDNGVVLTVTNKNNGVSVDKDFATLAELNDSDVAADAVKELINIVRGYESDEETNVCGW
ncbi:DUF1869 domain-containing protein [Dickeya chrysanthemi]|uniref:DUF1869 domain-containing protein n=1 Tax=Dickeya chrysanthemi TaxID=556 RepID=UPI0003A51040|nr:DUF1869 domain-containing protein [Dickeya chrysanthemi]WJM83741.1 DUF1869 domain-containing protein [Dickeya chrysanthemi]